MRSEDRELLNKISDNINELLADIARVKDLSVRYESTCDLKDYMKRVLEAER